MSPLHPEAGLRVGNRYLLTGPVAGGGMGEVWKATDDVLGREVAVKLLRREYAADEAFLRRFRAEARHAASLGHGAIAQVFDYGEDEGTAFLVMELVPGEPLSARLSREGAMPAAVAIPLLQQAAEGLDAAHATGLVHRDVKPGNLLITPDQRVKITDFGIARAGDQAPLTRTGEVMGTAQYLSPEQAMGRTATPASDVYALGVVAYEMLSGRRPFDGDTAVAIALAQVNTPPDPLPASVPAPVAAVVMQALAKDPEQRPVSAAAFAGSLGAALDGVAPAGATTAALATPREATTVLPPVALPLDPVTPAAPMAAATAAPADQPRRSRTGLVVGVVVLLLLVLGGVAFALSQGVGPGSDTAGGGAVTSGAVTSGTVTVTSGSTTSDSPSDSATSDSSSEPTSSTTSSSSSDTSSQTPDTFDLDEGSYLGRDADAVVQELRGKDLQVSTEDVSQSDAADGTVVGVSPTRGLKKGDAVAVQVARPTPTSSTSSPSSSSSSTSSSSTSSTESSQTSSSPSSSATSTASPAAQGTKKPSTQEKKKPSTQEKKKPSTQGKKKDTGGKGKNAKSPTAMTSPKKGTA